MSRTIRSSSTGETVRDGAQVRTIRRPNTVIRRQGTRADVVAAALAEFDDAPPRTPVRAARSPFEGL